MRPSLVQPTGWIFALSLVIGSWLWPSETWGLQHEARGRQVGVGSSDYMGEFSVGVARRFAGSGR